MGNSVYTAAPQITSLKRADVTDLYSLGGTDGHMVRKELSGRVHSKYVEDTKKSLVEKLSMMGRKRSTPQDIVYHLERGRNVQNVKVAAAAAGSGAGASKTWTIAAASHLNHRSFPIVGSVFEIAGTGMMVQVIGKDTGATEVKNRMGYTDAGVAVTAGSLGGTATAHKIIVVPKLVADTIPAVTTSTELINITTIVGRGSCPVDGIMPDWDRFEYGFSIVRRDIQLTGSTTQTQFACTDAEGFTTNVIADQIWIENEIQFLREVDGEAMFGVPVTNTGFQNNGTENDKNSGVITQIQNNGGLVHDYSTWTMSDWTTITNYLFHNGGDKKYLVTGGYQAISDIRADLLANGLIPVTAQIIVKGSANEDISINYDFDMIKYNGVEFYFEINDTFSQTNGFGSSYEGDAVFIPLGNTSVKGMDGKMNTTGKVNIWYMEGLTTNTMSGVRDYTNVGVSNQMKNQGCDYSQWDALAELCVEVITANQFVYLNKV